MTANRKTIAKIAEWVANTTKENETTQERAHILAKRMYNRYIRDNGKNSKSERIMYLHEDTIARKAKRILQERA